MQTVQDAAGLRATIRGWRIQGQTVGFVPTMGNLHEGHHSLIKLARARADRVVASVFVHPPQFGPGEDFERYPRTLAQDQAGLAEMDCDLLFAPDVATIYPFGAAQSVSVHLPGITDTLEGAHRPGHFDGVATVVCKLFNIVRPHAAVFGEKDFQQLALIRRMVRDLDMPVEIVSLATVREPDGLAMSSRNKYLLPDERQRATALSRALFAARTACAAGERNPAALVDGVVAELTGQVTRIDYVELRDAESLQALVTVDRPAVLAVAAFVGRTRLIDNVRLG